VNQFLGRSSLPGPDCDQIVPFNSIILIT